MGRWSVLLVALVLVGCGRDEQPQRDTKVEAGKNQGGDGGRNPPGDPKKSVAIDDGVSAAERQSVLSTLASIAKEREWKSPTVKKWGTETVGGWRKVSTEISEGDMGIRMFDLVFVLVNSHVVDVIDADDWANEKSSFTSTLPVVVVDGITLAEAYKDNEIAADKAYKNRTVQTKLTVIKVTKSSNGGAILLSSSIGLRVQMPIVILSLTQNTEAAKIDPPREITIRGHCIGAQRGVPVIRRAWVVKK